MTSAASASLSDTAFAAACIASAEAARTRMAGLLGPNISQDLPRSSHVPSVHEVMPLDEELAMYARADATRARFARLFSTVH